MDIVLENIIRIIEDKKISQKEFCRELNLSKSTFTDWKSGKNKSYLKHIQEISTLLDVEIGDLFGISWTTPEITLTDNERSIIELYRKLTDKQKDIVMDLILNMTLGA